MAVCVSPHLGADATRDLLERINLDYPGLEEVKEACGLGLWDRAGEELAVYYRRKTASIWFMRENSPPHPPFITVDGEAMLQGVFRFQNLTAVNPRLADGGLDWFWGGPRHDIEWTYYLNRHYFFKDAIDYHKAGGDPRYLDFIIDTLAHWLGACPCPEKAVLTAQWRVFEAAIRVGSTWPFAFYYLQDYPRFDTAAQLRMLRSILAHGAYVRAHHTGYRNHATLELGGLLRVTLYWPELAAADEWRTHAWRRLTYILEQAIYPDGAHKVLSSLYHRTALVQFLTIIRDCRNFSIPLPGLLEARVVQMLEYLACAMNPGGFGQLNNDCDLEDHRGFLKGKPLVMERPDLLYIVTAGAEGRPPDGLASRLYPWAGHVLMRDGWTPEAQCLFFDAGPAGVAHQHRDKLHISVYAGGRDLLVDSGRYTYKPGRMRDYFKSSAAHNVVLIGGCGQLRGKEQTRADGLAGACYSARVDFSRGAHEAGYRGLKGPARHERAVLYLKGRLWIVVDTVTAPGRSSIQALWHFHPHCTVVRRGLHVATADPGQGNLTIIPLAPDPIKWRPKIIKGRRFFGVQGWWSPTYNELYPTACAVYHARFNRSATFAWLLVPGGDEPPALSSRILSTSPHALCLELAWPGGERLHAAIRTAPDHPLCFSDGHEHDLDFVLADAREKITVIESGRLHP